mgnify:CR=1 FL=1
MKFVFILSGLKSAGLENYLLRFLTFCNSLDKDYHFTIICRGSFEDFNGTLHDKFLDLGVELIHLPMKLSSLSGYLSLYKLFKNINSDVVVDFSGYLAGPTMFLAWHTNISVRIAAYRESRYQFKMNFLKKLYVIVSKKLIIAFSTKIISNSKSAFDFFHKDYELNTKFRVIKNSINKPKEVSLIQQQNFLQKYQIPDEAFVIGHVGRFTPAKNHKSICEVIKSINKIDQSIYFILCGEGVCRGMNSLSGSLSNVIYIDHLSDLNVLYSCLDLFYFPSVNEGQPNVLLEAMSAGVAIIASNISPIIDSIPKEACEFLVDPCNSASNVKKILELRENRSLYPFQKVDQHMKEIYISERNFYFFLNELSGV